MIHEVSSPNTIGSSMGLFYSAVFAKAKHPLGYCESGAWIDVRDCAHAHALALEVSGAGMKRLILSNEDFVIQDWCAYTIPLAISAVVAQG